MLDGWTMIVSEYSVIVC